MEALEGSVTEIVVAGGIWYTDKVEIYEVQSGTWRNGGKKLETNIKNLKVFS